MRSVFTTRHNKRRWRSYWRTPVRRKSLDRYGQFNQLDQTNLIKKMEISQQLI